MALAGMVSVANIVMLLIVRNATANTWISALGLAVTTIAIIVKSFQPEWNRQDSYRLKEKKFVWKQKGLYPDVGNRRFLLMGATSLWLSLLNVTHTQLSLHDNRLLDTCFLIFILLTPVISGFLIWTEIKIMKLSGVYDHLKHSN